jgi:hypothetical protein
VLALVNWEYKNALAYLLISHVSRAYRVPFTYRERRYAAGARNVLPPPQTAPGPRYLKTHKLSRAVQ